MDRRTFLKATLVTAGSIALGPACDDEGTGPVDAGTDPLTDADAGRDLLPGDQFFPQSVASGDPKPDSVILWTRLDDPALEADDVDIELQVALDADFTNLVTLDGGTSKMVTAEAQYDHCVKVKVAGLDPATFYFYRFIHESGGDEYVTKTGRAKTAPAADADVAVRFGIANCQDYNGRYYNTLRRMLEEELDFVVHLGDYVYETTGDPQFQDTFPGRVVTFTDEAGAIVFNEGTDTEYFAAKSLSNYRELYKTYRSDPDLQAVHEKYPMIIIWDDHEFSNDCWDATGNYFNGRVDEHDVERRKNANQAWFEYIPVDYMGDEDFRYDRSATYPNDITIYRDFEFGANLHLVMTDERTYRGDHLVAEDAYPGAIAMDQAELSAALGGVPDFATPYVEIDDEAWAVYKTALINAADGLGIAPSMVAGNIAVEVINQSVEAINETLPEEDQIPLISEEDQAELDRGLAYFQILKVSPYSALGARYFVVKGTFDILAAFRWAQSDGASEAGLGDTQQSWFLDTMQSSTKTWKVWGNEYMVLPKSVDLTALPLPDAFKQVIRLSAEDWDGMPNRRDLLLDALSQIGNVVIITGDIHAFFAGTPSVSDDPTKKVPEFVDGAISSASYRTLLVRMARSDPGLAAAGTATLAEVVDQFLMGLPGNRPNPDLGYINVAEHGFAIAEVDADTFQVSYYTIPEELVSTDLGTGPSLDDEFSVFRFKVDAGSPDIYRDFDGTWKRWDRDMYNWV